MNIVIIGLGRVGRYVASLLSSEQHNVIVIDKDAKKLEEASWQMDVAVRQGAGSDWQLLDDLLELSPDLFIALTEDDEVNLVSCSIAKNLGYPKTICRLRDNRYLNRTRLDFTRLFDVDYFICPELLAAHDIFKYMISPGSLIVETFAHGAVQLRTIAVPSKWRKGDKTLSELKLAPGVMVGLIRRRIDEKVKHGKSDVKKVIFPHGNDAILPGDEVTFIGETEPISNIHQFFGASQSVPKSVAIVGGSLTGINLAKILEKHEIGIHLIDKDYEKCTLLTEELKRSTIMNHDATDLDFLLSEKIGQAELMVACTESDEVNLLIALLGKQAGCDNVVVQLSNPSYFPLIDELGITHTVSPEISAANRILSKAVSKTVTSMISLYDNQAQIVEINVSDNSKLFGIPVLELGPLLPKDFLIAMIQNRGRIMVAHGNRILSPRDTAIVVTHPKHLPELEKIF